MDVLKTPRKGELEQQDMVLCTVPHPPSLALHNTVQGDLPSELLSLQKDIKKVK